MDSPQRKIVFIDRDGVINIDLWKYVEHWKEFEFEPSALEALRMLTEQGFDIVIVSNQAGVGDGVFTETVMWDIHEKMLEVMKNHGVFIYSAQYCTHGKEANCECRKPKTGLLERAVTGLEFSRRKTCFVGDKLSDIEAGKKFGIKTILVRTGYGARTEAGLTKGSRPDYIVDNLKAAVPIILAAQR